MIKIKEMIRLMVLNGLQVMHQELEHLPWQLYVPSLPDLEQLVRVTDQCLPDVHAFLVNVWVRCPVPALIDQWKMHPPSTFTRFLTCLLHLYVRLAGEPTAQQVRSTIPLISTLISKFNLKILKSSF